MSHSKNVQNENFRTLLATGGEAYSSLVQAYLQQSPGKMKALENELAARKFKAITYLAQQLGESSAAIGAHKLAKHFSHLENASIHKDTENLLAAYNGIQAMYPAIITELYILLSQPGKKAA